MALEPVDIREVWPVVRDGLDVVKKTTNPPWIPEDIYSACVTKQAFLYMDRDRTKQGFAVVQSQVCEYEQISKFLIWVAYDPVYGAVNQYMSEWERLAKETGHGVVEFVTPIDALGRLTRRKGYEKVSSLYRKYL